MRYLIYLIRLPFLLILFVIFPPKNRTEYILKHLQLRNIPYIYWGGTDIGVHPSDVGIYNKIKTKSFHKFII